MCVNSRIAGVAVVAVAALAAVGAPIVAPHAVDARFDRLLNAPPTGDTNTTEAFACRPVRGSTAWSQHAYGLAVDVNPFQNPYHKGQVVLPELATAYLDRPPARPGMIQPGGPVVQAFTAIGWPWGGHYRSLKDYMHFSATGG